MKTLRLCLLSALAIMAALSLSSCNNKEQMKDSPAAGTPRAIIHTNYGDMTVEFWPDVAPRTVDNFLKLSREKSGWRASVGLPPGITGTFRWGRRVIKLASGFPGRLQRISAN